jgi:HK97 family phage prohead protease
MSDLDFAAVRIRGYAAVFNQVIDFGGELEYVARDAFDGLLGSGAAVALNYGTHDAPMIGRTTSLFADAFGLAFEAEINWSAAIGGLCRDVDGVSVCFAKSDRTVDYFDEDGREVYRISAASLDHMTLTAIPAYRATSVFLADMPLDRARFCIQAAAARWNASHAAWCQARATAAARAAQSVAAAKSRSERSLSALLAARRLEWDRVRGAMRNGQIPAGTVLGHAAFSKAAIAARRISR